MIGSQPLEIIVDGQPHDSGMQNSDELIRSVLLSLFTWRRANADDKLPDGKTRYGWAGDTVPTVMNDKFGSRLWLLSREVIVNDTLRRIEEYADEALKWLIDDNIAAKVINTAEKTARNTVALNTVLYKQDGDKLRDIQFPNIWNQFQ